MACLRPTPPLAVIDGAALGAEGCGLAAAAAALCCALAWWMAACRALAFLTAPIDYCRRCYRAQTAPVKLGYDRS